jgi:hypothetical protein
MWRTDSEAAQHPMISKTKASPAKRKKPRGEQLLDRIDKNPNDREAWNELARGSPTNDGQEKQEKKYARARARHVERETR